jgi:hypothetical protein
MQNFMATTPVKEIWIGEMTGAATLYYVVIDAGNPENKVDFRDEVWQCADQMLRSAKNQTTLFWVIWEMQLPQLLLMNGTILEIQNLSIQSVRCRSKSQND